MGFELRVKDGKLEDENVWKNMLTRNWFCLHMGFSDNKRNIKLSLIFLKTRNVWKNNNIIVFQ